MSKFTHRRCKTYTAEIYVGRRKGYEGSVRPHADVVKICRDYCDEVQLGLSIEEVHFTYVGGEEPGSVVRLINYPRFIASPEKIREKAFVLARILLESLEQYRLTVVMPDETVMLEMNQ